MWLRGRQPDVLHRIGGEIADGAVEDTGRITAVITGTGALTAIVCHSAIGSYTRIRKL